MSTRPSYKRAARSSFEVPQIPTHRLKLDRSDPPECIDRDPPRSTCQLQGPRDEVQCMQVQYSSQQDAMEQLSEFPFPHSYQLQPTIDRLTIDTPQANQFASWHMRSDRPDSWSSGCSPLSYMSPMPSLASSDSRSPLSPTTPQTPANVFSSAARSLKQIVMADELGMTLDGIKELDEFASLSVSGSEKRGGRVLPKRVYRPIRQRRSSTDSPRVSRRTSIRSARNASLPSNRLKLQSIEEWSNQADPDLDSRDWWKEVNWSRFSDSSSPSMSEGDVDTLADEPTRRLDLMSRRRGSSYRGCIFLPANHEHKLPYLKDVDMEMESQPDGQASAGRTDVTDSIQRSW